MTNIQITIAENTNVDDTVDLLSSLGVTVNTRNGQIISGTVSDNLVNPLRSVAGVANLEIIDIDRPAPVVTSHKPSGPDLTPPPMPSPSHVDSPAPTYPY